jgi:fused signal recognition particle receptor
VNPTEPPFADPLMTFVFLIGSLGILLGLIFLLKRGGKPRIKSEETPTAISAKTTPVDESPVPAEKETAVESPKPSSRSRWWNALSKTRLKFEWGSKKSEIPEIKAALEEAFLVSDLGVKNTEELISGLRWDSIASQPESERLDGAKAMAADTLGGWLSAAQGNSDLWPPLPVDAANPVVIWFVGVNGVGKTTSIAKLASELKSKGHSVLLAAGDTFRAAAGEQLEIWAQRLGIDCVRGAAGADSSSVLFDAIKSAQSKGIQYVLCDSAGRLHNQSQLMEALAKNKRVMEKALAGAPHQTLLVLDAHTGQNMLSQAQQFHQSVKLSGLILTKLDGSARGGAVVAVAKELGLPIRRLGLGESPEDFCEFQREPFISALLGTETAIPN